MTPDYPLVTAREFLEFSFSDRKAELDEGRIRVLDGVTARHSIVQGNLVAWFHERFRGGRRWGAYGTAMPIQTGPHSVRVADLAVFPWRDATQRDGVAAFDDPRIIFEIHSDCAPRTNLVVKLVEYKSLPSVDTIVFVDITSERMFTVQRTGPSGWNEQTYKEPVAIALPSLGLAIPHADIFARD